MVGFWSAILGFMFYVVEIIADQPPNAVCQDTGREEFGWALIGHDYKSSTAEDFGQCFFDCTLDEQCQSATFLWNTKECKLKKETKKSRPMDMEENPAATYMENPFRGILRHLGFSESKPIGVLLKALGEVYYLAFTLAIFFLQKYDLKCLYILLSKVLPFYC